MEIRPAKEILQPKIIVSSPETRPAEEIARLFSRSLYFTDCPHEDYVKGVVQAQQRGEIFEAVGRDNELVGALRFSGYGKSKKSRWVDRIATDINFRRQGIGRSLIIALMADMVERLSPSEDDVLRIGLAAATYACNSVSFYEKLGFKFESQENKNDSIMHKNFTATDPLLQK
jgi:predicted GNAT family N-acyltransferase